MLKKEYSKQYYLRHREKILKQTTQYNIEHRDEKLKYQHEYYQKTRLARLRYSKKYAKLHPDMGKYSDKKRFLNEQKKLMELKINGCAICGYNKCMRALEFHHINKEDKKFQIVAHCLRHKDEMVINEINKCILLCANCHREITARENGDYCDF